MCVTICGDDFTIAAGFQIDWIWGIQVYIGIVVLGMLIPYSFVGECG